MDILANGTFGFHQLLAGRRTISASGFYTTILAFVSSLTIVAGPLVPFVLQLARQLLVSEFRGGLGWALCWNGLCIC